MKRIDIYTSDSYKYYHGFADFVKGVAPTAAKMGYAVNTVFAGDKSLEDYIKSRLPGDQTIVLVLGLDEQREQEAILGFNRSNIPFILIHRFLPGALTHNTISINYSEAAEEITRHLIVSGRKRIAFLGFNESSSVDAKKLEGWEKALCEKGLPYSTEDVYKYGDSPLKEAVALFSSRITRYDAVVCSTDAIAMVLMKSELLKGVKIPEELAVVGFDNLKLGSIIKTRLTTISPDYESIGINAVNAAVLISKSIGIKNLKLICGHKLVVRDSCGALIRNASGENGGITEAQQMATSEANKRNNEIYKEFYFDQDIVAVERIEKFLYGIKPIEKQILSLILRGFVYKEIASLLFLSEAAVKYYLNKIGDMLDVKNKKELIALISRYLEADFIDKLESNKFLFDE